MIRFLIRKTIADYKNIKDAKVRGAYGRLAGVVGLFCNFLLFILKLSAGLLSHSVAILSDAFNNLSDMASSLVSLVGITVSGRHADEEHPFGHGRYEYIASLFVSFIIVLVGFELLRTSLGKIFHGETVSFSPVMLWILAASILVKFWMFSYNRYIGKTIQSMVVSATARDSINDAVATAAVLAGALLAPYVSLPLDGILGFLISILIIYTGYGVAKDTITVLLGAPPDPIVTEKIRKILLEEEVVSGIHDLILHDYGPGRMMGSVHVEVPSDGDIIKIHERIDSMEKCLLETMGIHMVIHTDPIVVNCERINELRNFVRSSVKQINKEFDIHDFRMTEGERVINLIFDLEVPCRIKQKERNEAVVALTAKLKERDERFNAVVQVDDKF